MGEPHAFGDGRHARSLRTRHAYIDAWNRMESRGERQTMRSLAAELGKERRNVLLYFPSMDALAIAATEHDLRREGIDTVEALDADIARLCAELSRWALAAGRDIDRYAPLMHARTRRLLRLADVRRKWS